MLDLFNKKLDFLVIGTQKGGTSALDAYLREHPEIGMGNIKEVHYFDNDDYFLEPKADYWDYHNYFNFLSGKKIYGETTPIYIYWEPAARRIYEYNPNIKLIAILRNPINRAFSHWNMLYSKNVERKDFEYCIENERERCRMSLPEQHIYYSYIDRGFYSEQIRRYKRYFKDEQMLFLKYEEFSRSQPEYLKEIFEFLGVEVDKIKFKELTANKINYARKINDKEKEYLKEIFKNDISEVERLLDWDCSDWFNF